MFQGLYANALRFGSQLWEIRFGSKYQKRNRNGGHDDFLRNCSIGCKKHAADRALVALRFSQMLLQESLRANDGFDTKWKFEFH